MTDEQVRADRITALNARKTFLIAEITTTGSAPQAEHQSYDRLRTLGAELAGITAALAILSP